MAFILNCLGPLPARAQDPMDAIPWMPKPGVMINLSPDFMPAHLTGIIVHPDNALRFDFLIDKGQQPLPRGQKKEEYQKLIKYFLASLTVPDNHQWVNLSPYEKQRIISNDFGKTEMGRDLLTQDYVLKQITASLMYPEKHLGKEFWDRVYQRAWQEYHTTQVPINTFNKVWIVPDEALVYENGNTAYILKSHLKVMMEEDYLSLAKHAGISMGPRGQDPNEAHTLASKIVKQIILPELEREVNEGKNFALLRQIYSGMILATWYKKELKESLLGKVYADKAKVKGVDQDPKNDQVIYQRYLRAFKKGVFNYIKEDVDKYTQQAIPRKYFSGGFDNALLSVEEIISDPAQVAPAVISDVDNAMQSGKIVEVTANMDQAGTTPKNSMIYSTPSQIGEKAKNLLVWPNGTYKTYAFQIDFPAERFEIKGVDPYVIEREKREYLRSEKLPGIVKRELQNQGENLDERDVEAITAMLELQYDNKTGKYTLGWNSEGFYEKPGIVLSDGKTPYRPEAARLAQAAFWQLRRDLRISNQDGIGIIQNLGQDAIEIEVPKEMVTPSSEEATIRAIMGWLEQKIDAYYQQLGYHYRDSFKQIASQLSIEPIEYHPGYFKLSLMMPLRFGSPFIDFSDFENAVKIGMKEMGENFGFWSRTNFMKKLQDLYKLNPERFRNFMGRLWNSPDFLRPRVQREKRNIGGQEGAARDQFFEAGRGNAVLLHQYGLLDNDGKMGPELVTIIQAAFQGKNIIEQNKDAAMTADELRTVIDKLADISRNRFLGDSKPVVAAQTIRDYTPSEVKAILSQWLAAPQDSGDFVVNILKNRLRELVRPNIGIDTRVVQVVSLARNSAQDVPTRERDMRKLLRQWPLETINAVRAAYQRKYVKNDAVSDMNIQAILQSESFFAERRSPAINQDKAMTTLPALAEPITLSTDPSSLLTKVFEPLEGQRVVVKQGKKILATFTYTSDSGWRDSKNNTLSLTAEVGENEEGQGLFTFRLITGNRLRITAISHSPIIVEGSGNDAAMVSRVDQAAVARNGGIDLNAANLNLMIKRNGKGVPLPLDQQDLAQLAHIQGFVPEIIEIKPVTSLPMFSQVSPQNPPSAQG